MKVDPPDARTRDIARRILEHELRREPSGDAATATTNAFERVHALLVDVVGHTGVRALLDRAVFLARSDPSAKWLENASFEYEPTMKLKGLEAAKNERPAHVLEGASALMAHLIALLSAFIGEELTRVLLHRIWTDVPRDDSGSAWKEGD